MSKANRMSKRAWGWIALSTLLCSSAGAQPSPLYTLYVPDAVAVEGGSLTVPLLLDNEGIALDGWSYGLCSDPSRLMTSSFETGAATATVNNGSPPGFHTQLISPEGFSGGVVID